MDVSFMDITVVLNLGTITKRISVKLKTASFGTTWIDMSLVVVHLSFCPLNGDRAKLLPYTNFYVEVLTQYWINFYM